MIRIRKIQDNDFESVKAMLNEDQKITPYIRSFVVFEENNKLLGCGCGIVKENCVYVSWIFSQEEHRRKRIASSIVKSILNTADLNGANKAYMQTDLQEFAAFLKFSKVNEQSTVELRKEFIELYNTDVVMDIYEAELKGYFSCNCK